MKYLLISLLVAVFGCSEPKVTKIEWNQSNLIHLNNLCKKLGKCMGFNSELIHFRNQSHNPYACSLDNQQLGINRIHHYIYPSTQYTNSEDFWVGWSVSFENAITICQMMTETEEFSLQKRIELIKVFDKLDKEKKEQENREIETIKQRNEELKQIINIKEG